MHPANQRPRKPDKECGGRLTSGQARLLIDLDENLPRSVQDGHPDLVECYETVKRFEIYYEVTHSISLGKYKGVCKQPFF